MLLDVRGFHPAAAGSGRSGGNRLFFGLIPVNWRPPGTGTFRAPYRWGSLEIWNRACHGPGRRVRAGPSGL